jgi:hypothetical protein
VQKEGESGRDSNAMVGVVRQAGKREGRMKEKRIDKEEEYWW